MGEAAVLFGAFVGNEDLALDSPQVLNEELALVKRVVSFKDRIGWGNSITDERVREVIVGDHL